MKHLSRKPRISKREVPFATCQSLLNVTCQFQGEKVRMNYVGAMGKFFRFWVEKKPKWNPSVLLEMGGKGPLPKLPPLEQFVTEREVPATS